DRLESHFVAAAAGARPPATARPGLPGKPAPAPAPGPPKAPPAPAIPDALATTPLPITGRNNKYWTVREGQNETRLRDGHASLLFLGDSTTDGFQTVGQSVWDTFWAPLDAEDFAIAGLTTSEVLWQVETGQVARASPDVVVLMIGTNNLGLGQSPPAVA